MKLLPVEIIKKKRDGQILSHDEINDFIQSYTRSEIPDYQAAALLMAIFFQGLNADETQALTQSMLHSGMVVDLSSIPGFKVDKHSTGGVGDKTSLILGPLVAAAGHPVPMISGRGLGHTGGTLDKLESIPGFNTQLDLETFKRAVRQHGICFIGQTPAICPADKKLYALRDVTSTIDSLPLICASIMSKKLAEGIDGLVLDVKFGSGAFMKSVNDAEELARRLSEIARGAGKKVTALVTNMNQPLGRFAGNSLEIFECVEIMQGKSFLHEGRDLYQDTRDLSVELAAEMIHLAEPGKSLEACRKICFDLLKNGEALKKFEVLCEIHGGKLSDLPHPPFSIDVLAPTSGFISEMKTELIGILGIHLKAGRKVMTDVIEPTSGIEFLAKVSDSVQKGQVIARLHGPNQKLLQDLSNDYLKCIEIKSSKIAQPKLIEKTIS